MVQFSQQLAASLPPANNLLTNWSHHHHRPKPGRGEHHQSAVQCGNLPSRTENVPNPSVTPSNKFMVVIIIRTKFTYKLRILSVARKFRVVVDQPTKNNDDGERARELPASRKLEQCIHSFIHFGMLCCWPPLFAFSAERICFPTAGWDGARVSCIEGFSAGYLGLKVSPANGAGCSQFSHNIQRHFVRIVVGKVKYISTCRLIVGNGFPPVEG